MIVTPTKISIFYSPPLRDLYGSFRNSLAPNEINPEEGNYSVWRNIGKPIFYAA
jgi:hypothetical protein